MMLNDVELVDARPVDSTDGPTHDEMMRVADEIRRSPFGIPMSLFVMSHLPLRGMATACIEVLMPFLSVMVPRRPLQVIRYVLEDPDRWHAFVERLQSGGDESWD